MNFEKAKRVLRKIKTLSKEQPQFSVNEIRIIAALEGAVARLTQDKELSNHLIFKGGFVLLKSYRSKRFTRDADALAIDISREKILNLIQSALAADLDDGFWFGDVRVEDLKDQDKYGVFRFDCAFHIGQPDLNKVSHLSRIHIDIGFSDQVTGAGREEMQSVLDMESPVKWKIYPPEFIVSEKLQTLIERGSSNSRAKDLYDMNYLIPLCSDKHTLLQAITETFMIRKTELPLSFVAAADRIDRTILKAGWPGIEVDQKGTFEEAWRTFLFHLKDLDVKKDF
jgi:predicted nucleotidyltransferase component of viral defense system